MDNPFDIILSELNQIKEAFINMPKVEAAPPPEIIDTMELCKRLDITEPTAIKWRGKKKLPFFRVGNSVRYNWPKVISSLENQKA